MLRPTSYHRIDAPHVPEEALDRSDIAEIPLAIVEQLTPAELRRLIEASRHPWRPELQDLQFADPGVIKRLAYLARFCCRNQQAAACEEQAAPVPDETEAACCLIQGDAP